MSQLFHVGIPRGRGAQKSKNRERPAAASHKYLRDGVQKCRRNDLQLTVMLTGLLEDEPCLLEAWQRYDPPCFLDTFTRWSCVAPVTDFALFDDDIDRLLYDHDTSLTLGFALTLQDKVTLSASVTLSFSKTSDSSGTSARKVQEVQLQSYGTKDIFISLEKNLEE